MDADHALIEIGVLDALEGRQLTGPYSRFGFRHPGPALFYLLSPAYHLSGGRYLACSVTAATVNVACLLALWWVCTRRSGMAQKTWIASVLGLFALYLGPSVLASPWNPHLVILPLAVLSVGAATAVCGTQWLWPLVCICASFVMQSHLGLVPVTTAGLVTAAIARVWFRSRIAGARFSVSSGPRLATACCLLVMWYPVLLDQLSSAPGNLTRIVEFLRSSDGDQSWLDSGNILLQHLTGPLLAPFGIRLATSPASRPLAATVVLGLAVLIGLAVAAWPRGKAWSPPSTRILARITLVQLLTSWWAVHSITGELHAYLVRWIAALGLTGALAILACLQETRRRTREPVFRLIAAVIAIAVCVAGITSVLGYDDVERLAQDNRIVRADAAARAAEGIAALEQDRAVHMSFDGAGTWSLAAAISVHLMTRGYDVAIDPEHHHMFGDRRLPTPTDIRLTVVEYKSIAEKAARFAFDTVWSDSKYAVLRMRVQAPISPGIILGLPAAEPYLLGGFHPPEHDSVGPFVWSRGPESRIVLVLPEGTSRRVCLEAAPLPAGPSPQAITFTLNDRHFGNVSFEKPGTAKLCLGVPASLSAGFHMLGMRYRWSTSPHALGRSQDRRPLAVKFRRLWVETGATNGDVIPARVRPPAPRSP